ncbi:MAG: PHP domain-containing protein [Methylophilaceae bacterium]|nr:PHP domain-containing protein [Methylophilaceae bacterium]
MSCNIDLHSHSTVSDGQLAPAELVRHAASKGVRVLALTDHDDVGGLREAMQAALETGIVVVPGVEISVTWNGHSVHVVGLKIDPEFAPLRAGLQRLRESRHARAEAMAHSLARAGIAGSLEGAYAYATPGGVIGRVHFARFLVERGVAKDVRSVFKRFLVKGKPGYHEHRWASLEEAIGWILGSGGIPVLAHPGRYALGRTTMLRLLHEFRELGGQAIEVVTASHPMEQIPYFARLARQFSLLASVGSDYHGPTHGGLTMGHLPELSSICVPVWHDWPEASV